MSDLSVLCAPLLFFVLNFCYALLLMCSYMRVIGRQLNALVVVVVGAPGCGLGDGVVHVSMRVGV